MEKKLSFNIMYQALVEKDKSFEGIFIACVKTTGVFCRPTCRARKPKEKNVEFFETTEQALLRGYRPCKVCHPMKPVEDSPDWIDLLMEQVYKSEGLRFKDWQIREMGLDSNRVRRWFKKNHNMTFQAFLRSLRIGNAHGYLVDGEKVIDTAYKSGYESLSGFNTSFKKLTKSNPNAAKTKKVINSYKILTPLGPMIAASVEDGICLLEFVDRRMLEKELNDIQKKFNASIITFESNHIKNLKKQLEEYFQGKRKIFDIPLCSPGSEFQLKVWDILKTIPYGVTSTYKKQAQKLKSEKAIRAVANANGANRISILIPCHRVIGSDGSMTGYGGGIWRKKKLLELELKNRG